MRNDARPIGEDAGRLSPVPSDPAARGRGEAPAGDRVNRQSHIANRRKEDSDREKDAPGDPVMPARDSSLNTKI
jgi:hypothetical protein